MMAPPPDKPFVFEGDKTCQGINVPPPVLDDNKKTCDHILWTASSQDGWLQVEVEVEVQLELQVCVCVCDTWACAIMKILIRFCSKKT